MLGYDPLDVGDAIADPVSWRARSSIKYVYNRGLHADVISYNSYRMATRIGSWISTTSSNPEQAQREF
jgi:hypothetical protein